MRIAYLWSSMLAVAAAFPQPAAAQSDGALTSRERRAQSATAANRQTRRDLLSILKGPGKIRRGNMIAVRGVVFTTPSYGTTFPGLCRRDQVVMSYAPLGDGRSDDEAVRPYGVAASAQFRLVGKPALEQRDRTPDATIWRAACAGLDDDEQKWFSANDDTDAIEGVMALQFAGDAVRRSSGIRLDCQLSGTPTVDCAQAARSIRLDTIYELGRCTDQRADRSFCFVYSVGNYKVTVHGTGDLYDPASFRIQSILLGDPDIIIT